MAKYNYVLSDQGGKKTKGVISAPSKTAAMEKLKSTGSLVISCSEISKKASFTLFKTKPKLKLADKMLFINSLSIMIKIGITLTEAFQIIIYQSTKPRTKKMFENILEMINSGENLSNALKKFKKVFSPLFVNMIETGEKSGNLGDVLEYLYTQMEKEYELRKKMSSAAIYPAIIISITFLMAVGIVIFIMPKITKIFQSFEVQLPLPTRILIGFSTFIIKNPLITIFTVSIFVTALIFLIKSKFLKPVYHRLFLVAPLIGDIVKSSNVARFARTLNSLLKSGTQISESMIIIGKMFENQVYKNAILDVSKKIAEGAKLGENLEKYPKLFPPLATKMIYLGEKTGSLELTTERIAVIYENHVDIKTKNLATLMEPLLLVFMGGFIGGIAISIILPIYQLPNLISK